MPDASPVPAEITLLCFPPVDAVFQRAVRERIDATAPATASELQRALRPMYPRAVVRERDALASFGGRAWYVYRDGRYSPFVRGEPWWQDPDAAALILTDDGHYVDATPAALELFGVTLESLRTRPPGSFTVPEFHAMVPWILQLLRDTGELHSTSIARPADGRPDVPVEYHVVRDADGPGRHRSTMRPVPLEAVLGEEVDGPRPVVTEAIVGRPITTADPVSPVPVPAVGEEPVSS